MLDKLKELERNYTELERKLQEPEVYTDNALYTRLAKEQKELQPVVEAYRRREMLAKSMEEARELLSDPELHDIAQEEYNDAKAGLEKADNELKILLLPKDPNDDKNVIVEIRCGVGGEESALFAHSLFRMYSMYAENRRWKYEIANINETELGGIKEISFIIEGDGAYSRLKFESGVHRVQRVPDTESGGRIHTSTVTVAVLPEMDELDFHINPNEIGRAHV